MKKSLPNLDINHPFYSDQADKVRAKILKRLEQEEKQLAKENLKRYHDNQKRRKDGDKEVLKDAS